MVRARICVCVCVGGGGGRRGGERWDGEVKLSRNLKNVLTYNSN